MQIERWLRALHKTWRLRISDCQWSRWEQSAIRNLKSAMRGFFDVFYNSFQNTGIADFGWLSSDSPQSVVRHSPSEAVLKQALGDHGASCQDRCI